MSEASAWARTLVGALARAGVKDVVISPGSRCTALVFAADAEPELRLHSVIDERSAAFFALGQARVTGRPSALVCTSGTAGAHYYPAVIEAAMAYVPLLVITADRPAELQSSSAPQTIDQQRLYGPYARAFHDLGLPNDAPVAHAAVRRRAAQAVFQTMSPTPGPVHVNVPARKPFEPDPEAARPDPVPPGPAIVRPARRLEPAGLRYLSDRLERARKPVILVGPGPVSQSCLRAPVAALAARTGALVYAEATSQLRFGASMPGDALGLLLSAPRFAADFDPDLVLQLGGPVTSGDWHRWLAAHPEVPLVAVAPHAWPDPSQRAESWLVAEPSEVVAALNASSSGATTRLEGSWRSNASERDRDAWRLVEQLTPPGAEGEVVRVVRAMLPEDSVLMLGNSLPVRHFDAYVPSGGPAVQVLSQRGANGIDGLLAGAAGAAVASERPVTLVLGDVSFFHDAGALALARRLTAPLVIVVLDNGGGRIFDLLPAGRRYGDAPVFDYFATPPGLEASELARAFGLAHARVDGSEGLGDALTAAYRETRATVLQVTVPDHGARSVLDRVVRAIDAGFEPGSQGG